MDRQPKVKTATQAARDAWHTDAVPLPYLDFLAESAAELARVLAGADLQTAVPACPGWTLAELGEHVIEMHRWALSRVIGAEAPALPSDLTRAEQLSRGAAQLNRALREHAWDEPCEAIYPPDIVGTWARRQALETALHAWDATDAVGHATEIDPALAADGIAEVANDMYPRQVRLGRQTPLEAAVEFELNDVGARVTLLGASGASAAATLVGEASAILLVLWGRRPLDATTIEVRGDPTAVRALLNAKIVP